MHWPVEYAYNDRWEKKATTSTAICRITRKGKRLIDHEYELFLIDSLLLQWYGADEIQLPQLVLLCAW